MKSKLLQLGGLPLIAAVLAAILPAAAQAQDEPNLHIQERFDLEQPIPIPDPIPCPVLRAGDIRQEKRHHDVKLYFPWSLVIDESTLSDGDIVARGPNGYVQGGKLVSVERLPVPFPLPLSTVPEGTGDVYPVPQPHPILVATYRFFPPPGVLPVIGNWTSEDNGTYGVRLAPGEIATEEGRFLPSKFLGAFRCAIRDVPGTPVQPVEVRIDIRRVPAPSLSPDATVPVPRYQAVVKIAFNTPHVEVDWGSVLSSGNRFVANITALKLPLPDPDIWPVPLPLAGEAELLDPSGEPVPIVPGGPLPPEYPTILPIFTHVYDLGPLPPGVYNFIARVNGINEGAKSFTVPPIPPVDDQPPAAELEVRNITRPFNGPHRLAVTYKDRSGVDVSTLGDGDLVVLHPCLFVDSVTPVPCNWRAQRARLIEVIPLSNDRTKVKAIYEIDPPQGGWTAANNGFYPVVQPADAVCDRLGNCNPRRRLGGFEVAIDPNDPPIPAKAEIRVDSSNPDRVKAKVHVKFDGYYRIVNQDIRRVGNRILLLATAEPYFVPAIFPPPPFPEEDLLYEIGPLEPGHYVAAFIMNRHTYDTEQFRVRRQPPIPAEVQLTINSSDPSNVTAEVVIQFETPHRVEQGDVQRDGYRIVLPAKAEPLPVPLEASIAPPIPAPVTLTYNIGALPNGGYLGVFVMNDFPYAAEHFVIDRCDPPIAEAGIRIDQDDPANTVAVVKVAFFSPHAIVGRDIHRRGNYFLLEAKAVPIYTLDPAAEFAPVPIPQIVTIEYPLGDLDPGQYGAKFVLNGCPLADTSWVERGDTFEADVSIVTSETSSGHWNAEVTILFRNPHVRITDPGEVVFDGHIIRIGATAELPAVTPQNEPPSVPIVLNYDLGDLEPGGWWLKYFINGNFEKQHDFFVRPDPPIPADVELRVDVSSQPVIAHKRIQFRDHYRIVDQGVARIGNVFFLDAEAEGPLPILAPLPPPPIDLTYDLGNLPRGFYLAACRINGHIYDVVPFWVPDQGFEAEVDLSVDVGDTVKLKAVVDIDDPYVIVTDWGTPVISASGEIKINATAQRVVFIQEPSGDPMEHCYDLGALRPGVYHVTFCLNGQPEARLRFRVPEPCDPLPHVAAINISQGNVSWFSEVVIALLPGQVLTDCGVVRRSNNKFHVNITVECLDFPEPPVPLPTPLPNDPSLPEGIVFTIEEVPTISGVPIRLVKCRYVLGPLDQGHYAFCVHSRGQTVACKRFEVPGMPPSVNLLAGNLTHPTDEHRFGIEFQDPTGLNHECIMNAPVWIVGPDGYREEAQQLTYTSTDDDPSTYANARYAVNGPGGSWDHTDNGRYCVYVNPEDIKDLDGNHIENGRLGCFHVRIAPPPDPGVNVSVAMNNQGEWEATVEIISAPGEQVVVDDWNAVSLNFGVVFLRLATAHLEPTSGPVEPLAHVYNLGTLTPGTYIFVFKTNLGHCGSATFEVPGIEGDLVDSWGFRNGLAEATEGEVLESYYFATTPGSGDTEDVTPVVVTYEDGSLHFGIEYRRLVGADGVNAVVEASGNVGAWVDATDLTEVRERTVDADGTETVVLCLREPLAVSPYHYLRIRLDRDQP